MCQICVCVYIFYSVIALFLVGSVIDMLLKENPSLLCKKICSNCETQRNILSPTIHPDLIPLYKNGFYGLQEALDKHHPSEKKRV